MVTGSVEVDDVVTMGVGVPKVVTDRVETGGTMIDEAWEQPTVSVI